MSDIELRSGAAHAAAVNRPSRRCAPPIILLITSVLSACSLSPDFVMPDIHLPGAYKEQPPAATQPEAQTGNWKPAQPLEKADRGQWWKIFNDAQLNELEAQAEKANPSLAAAAARVQEARATVRANAASYLPDIDIGANALRTKEPAATFAEFGEHAQQIKPFDLYSTQATLSYETDLFGQVRDNEKALSFDADAQAASYRSVLLALQADVAQHYFSIREADAERVLLRGTVNIRTEAVRIMQAKWQNGAAGQDDLARTKEDLASAQADLTVLERNRAVLEHALATLLGKTPAEFSFAEAPLIGTPPAIPAGLPSTLLERRPDVNAAQAMMQAANKRIGVARAAFFPDLFLTASGGVESVTLGDLFKWSARTWALGQLAGSALTMNVFDSGRNFGALDAAHAAYNESVANYRAQVLVAFRDVEDNLSDQRLLAQQAQQADAAADAADQVAALTRDKYDAGDVDYFEVVSVQRDELAAERAALQVHAERFITTITLIRALGGGWAEAPQAAPQPASKPAPQPTPLPAPPPSSATPPPTPLLGQNPR